MPTGAFDRRPLDVPNSQYDRGVARIAALAGIVLLMAACSGSSPFASAVFVGAAYDTVDCAGGVDACVKVTSAVDGSAAGTGSCILYATTSEGQVAVAASGELELMPGEITEWTVRVPAHLGSLGWNPVCEPTAEG